MPPKSTKDPGAPPVMTWSKAFPVLAFAVIADLARAFFNTFWFFGPAFAAIFCAAYASNTTLGSLVGTTISSTVCAAGAAIVGAGALGPMAAFGVIMADSVGFAAFLILAGLIVTTNRRLFKVNGTAMFQFVGGFAVAEIPFIGALPAFTFVLWRLYRHQIKVEKAAFKKYEAQRRVRVIGQQQAQLAQAQAEVAQRAEVGALEQAAAEEAEGRAIENEATLGEASGGVSGETRRSERLREEGSVSRATTEETVFSEAGKGGQETRRAGVEAGEFDTLHDALSELNSKTNRTPEENKRLLRAKEIMRHVSIDPTESRDPVLFAAYERARQGQKVFDGTPETRGGFVFSLIKITGGRASSQEAANEEIPENRRRVA